jgi:serine/threonine protein kinase
MENLTGRQLGAYQIVAPLGEGGMAAVYKAYQPGMERYVALKVLPQQLAKDPQFVGRFKQEAKVLANLQHPHILPVFDYGESDGYTYIVMPLVKSGTLDDLMVGKPLPLEQVNRIISQVGDALDYAHTQGLIHRDIKPSNILVDERGNCLLTDFGIAKIFEGTARFTQTGGIIGTPAYMSPEQGKGDKVDARSDIYSLGIVLYEMVTGRVPFDAETPIAIVFKHIQDPLPLARSIPTCRNQCSALSLKRWLSSRKSALRGQVIWCEPYRWPLCATRLGKRCSIPCRQQSLMRPKTAVVFLAG